MAAPAKQTRQTDQDPRRHRPARLRATATSARAVPLTSICWNDPVTAITSPRARAMSAMVGVSRKGPPMIGLEDRPSVC